MTLVRERSSEGWRRELGVGLGDRRYQRRSLGWLVAVTMVVVVAATAEMAMVVVVEWRQGVGTGGKWGQINANMCGKLHRDRSQDPRGKRGLYVFLCHSLSRNPLRTLSASVYSISPSFLSVSLSSSSFSFFFSLRSFTRILSCFFVKYFPLSIDKFLIY